MLWGLDLFRLPVAGIRGFKMGYILVREDLGEA
jgi:hypothetical protein